MNHSPVSPAVVHLLDWQAALASQPDGLSEAAQDAAIADWAQRCWLDLAVALPHQHHAVLAHPGNLQTAARCYLYAGEAASGWLHSPLHGTPEAPHWNADSAALADEAARLALGRGFCAADAAVLGLMGALAAIDTRSNTLPDDFTRQRRHFPLLGAPRALPFASMPRSLRQPAHPHRLYAVMGDADWVIRCLELGVKLVQLRLKNPAPGELDTQIARCAEAASRHGALLIINDHWEAALRHTLHRNSHGIYGIHLGQEDLQQLSDADLDRIQLAGLRLGLSTHSLWELSRALRTRPSHLACGPVHATTTKDMPWIPLGDSNVGWWAQLLHADAGSDHPPLPLVAIGGMTPVRAQAAAAAGADMVAVVSDITGAADPAAAVQALEQAIASGQAQRDAQPAPTWPEPTLPA